jgi:translation initiation factor IF-2
VVAPLAGDDLRLVRSAPHLPVVAGRLDRRIDCLGPARGEVEPIDAGVSHPGEPLAQRDRLRVRAAGVSGAVGERLHLLGGRLDQFLPPVPDGDVPQAGDQFKVFKDEKKARVIGETRAMKQKESERQSTSKVNLDELFQQIQQGEVKELNLIIKADVQGSAEALRSSLEKINVEDVNIKIIHSGVGAITESDVSLAAASNAIVIGFNVRPQGQAKLTAEREQVDIRLPRII